MNQINNYLTEYGWRFTSSLKDSVSGVPKVSSNKFVELMQPGDIVPCGITEQSRTAGETELLLHLNATVQGGPYTTLKLVAPDGSLVSFALQKEDDGTHYHKVDPKKYLRFAHHAVLLRVPDMTETQKNQMFKFFFSKPKAEYGYEEIAKSLIKRMLRLNIGPKPEELKVSAIRKTTRNLICSSAVALALYQSGIKYFPNPFQTFPKDFLLNPHFQKICQIYR